MSIAIVGPKTPLRICEEAELSRFLALVEGEERRGGGASATGDAGAAPEREGGDEPRDRDPQPAVSGPIWQDEANSTFNIALSQNQR